MTHFPMPNVGDCHMWPGVYLLVTAIDHCDAAGAGDRLRRAWPALKRSGSCDRWWGTLFEVLRAHAVLSGPTLRWPSMGSNAWPAA